MTRLAESLVRLRSEFDLRWPDRNKASDGTIGDAAHRAQPSDHNPNSAGVICAMDVDTDLDGTNDSNDPEMDAIVEWIRLHPHPDIKYVIYRWMMFSAYPAWGYGPFEWRGYPGDSHVSHPHFSVGVGRDGQSVEPYDDTDTWLPPVNDSLPPAIIPVPLELEVEHMVLQHNGDYLLSGGKIVALNVLLDKSVPRIPCDDGQWTRFINAYGQPVT